MTYLKTMMAASAAAIVLATPAFADVTVRITGSTAFRTATNAAISNVFAASGNTLTNFGYAGGTQSSADKSVWRGTISGVAGTVIVKTSFQGSVGGVQTLDQDKTRSDWGQDTWSGSGQSGTDGTTITADVALSDSFQASTIYNATTLTDKVIGVIGFVWTKGGAAQGTGSTPPAGSWTNMTSLNARAFLGGRTSLQLFTGNTLDAGKFTLAQGRDEDSGTRLEAFAVSGYGILTKPVQYESNYTASSSAVSRVFVSNAGGTGYTSAPTVTFSASGGSGAAATVVISGGAVKGFTLTSGGSGYTANPTVTFNNAGTGGSGASARTIRGPYIAPHSPQTVLGDFQAIGTSGYASGGTLAGQVNNVASLTTPVYTALGNSDAGNYPLGSAYPVTYVSKGDNNTVNSGKNALSYDGVFYIGDGTGLNNTEHPEVIQNGTYSFWSFEHLMYRSTASTDTKTVADLIATEAKTNTASASGISLSTMTVSRATDAAAITIGAPSLP
ncbi:MAG: hypothetical protein ABIP20_00920 [Chthoniobacteraceae bacterium]